MRRESLKISLKLSNKSRFPSIIPCRFQLRRNETHRPFRQRGDGQAGIDAQICRHHRPVTNINILVSKKTMVSVNHPVLGRICDHASSDTMGCARNIKQDLREHAQRKASGKLRKLLGELVCFGNVSRYFLSAADQKFTEGPEPWPLPVHLNLAFHRLHAEQDHKFPCPTQGLQTHETS